MRQITRLIIESVVIGLALAFIVLYLFPSLQQSNADQDNPGQPSNGQSAGGPVTYAPAVDRAAPSVVSIYTISREIQTLPPDIERLTGRQRTTLRRGLGSGVIVSSDGYILTNYHVIRGVQGIRVALWDGRIVEAPKVVGSDPETDLAVLKVNLEGLPSAPFADAPQLRVGDVVLAIGNALGLDHTVTMGIISATGRNELQSYLYEDFIQTDAPINQGNSGGALINPAGEVIGINTVYFSTLLGRQGAQGIGFAIPVTLARDVMRQIIEVGSVSRGWLGATFSNTLAVSTSGISSRGKGVYVTGVRNNGPAWEAGLRPGDIILELDAQAVEDAGQFYLTIAQIEPGTQVEMSILRNGETFQTYAILTQQPPLR